MKTKTGIVHRDSRQWEIVEVDLDGPRQGELLIKMAASGLCHSDDH
jgi:Zn-dependent alcohol dehydrogenase